jgi:transposase
LETRPTGAIAQVQRERIAAGKLAEGARFDGIFVLAPDSLEDHATDDNPVRAIDVFIDELDLAAMGFGIDWAAGLSPGDVAEDLKICLYAYLNRSQSSRRLERESQRNISLMWLTAFGCFSASTR